MSKTFAHFSFRFFIPFSIPFFMLFAILFLVGCVGLKQKQHNSSSILKKVGTISFKLSNGSGFGTVVSEIDSISTKISIYSPVGSKMAVLVRNKKTATVFIDGEEFIYPVSTKISEALYFVPLSITIAETINLLSATVPTRILQEINKTPQLSSFEVEDGTVFIKKTRNKIKAINFIGDYSLLFSSLNRKKHFRKIKLTQNDGTYIKVNYE